VYFKEKYTVFQVSDTLKMANYLISKQFMKQQLTIDAK